MSLEHTSQVKFIKLSEYIITDKSKLFISNKNLTHTEHTQKDLHVLRSLSEGIIN